MNKMKVGIHNRFDVFKKNAITGEEKQVAYAENIILDALWATINTANYWWGNSISIGTGTGTLSPARTTLFTQLANFAIATNVYTYMAAERTWSRRMSFTISEAEYVGSFIREIGMVKYNSSTGITTHALFKDMNGNPVAIEKTDTDIITFYATVYAVFDTEFFDTDAIRVFNVLNLRTSFINACLGLNIFSAGSFYYNNTHDVLSDTGMSGLSPVFRAGTAAITLAWNASLKKITLTAARLAAGSGNAAAGIWSAFWTAGNINFDITKSSSWLGSYIEDEPIGTGDGVTVDFRTAFSKLSGTTIIKVDGIAESGVTIEADTLQDDDLNRYLRIIECDAIKALPGYAGTSGTSSPSSAVYCIAENPLYATYGISHVFAYRVQILVSNDLENWVEALANSTSSSDRAVPAEYQGYRYWKAVLPTGDGSWTVRNSTLVTAADLMNVHFASPPAVGALLTATYTTKIVAKDINHVFDFVAEVYLGEYIPA